MNSATVSLKTIFNIILVLATLSTYEASGQSGAGQFDGDIENTCSITILNSLGLVRGNFNRLVTDVGGPDEASVFATSNDFDFWITNPADWIDSPEGTPATIFNAEAFLDGATYNPELRSPYVQRLNYGTTDVGIFIEAIPQNGYFNSGYYEVAVTLTCG